jgi:hypothetical protein
MPAPVLAAGAKLAFKNAALTAVFDAVPKLVELFKGPSEVAQRNAGAVQVLLDTAKNVTQAKNEQEIVEVLATDPTKVLALQQAIEARWFELHKVAEESTRESRKWIAEYSQIKDVRIVAGNMTFIELLSAFLVVVGTLGGLGLIVWGDLPAELDGAIITLILIESVVGVRKAWIGNTPNPPSSQGINQQEQR